MTEPEKALRCPGCDGPLFELVIVIGADGPALEARCPVCRWKKPVLSVAPDDPLGDPAFILKIMQMTD